MHRRWTAFAQKAAVAVSSASRSRWMNFDRAPALLLAVALIVGPSARADIGDPNFYAASLDTDVTYDSALAESYDDGYGPRAYAQFETALAPYGTWVDEPALGRVWVPAAREVGADFAPYWTNGRWVFTEYGWTWDSGWEWGWAPFHYGRWAMVEGRGWCWVPGTLWGPSWVAWRAGRINVGWAPLPPRGMNLGRPIGTRSPWRFARAATLGTTVMEPVPLTKYPRAVRAHCFGHDRARGLDRPSQGTVQRWPDWPQVLRRSHPSSPLLRGAGATRGAPLWDQASARRTVAVAPLGCRGSPRADADPPLAELS